MEIYNCKECGSNTYTIGKYSNGELKFFCDKCIDIIEVSSLKEAIKKME